jgi:hypothetical protein
VLGVFTELTDVASMDIRKNCVECLRIVFTNRFVRGKLGAKEVPRNGAEAHVAWAPFVV